MKYQEIEKDSSLPLRKDVKLFGDMLGEILVYQGGSQLIDTVEKFREKAKLLRDEYSEEAYQEFKDEIQQLDPIIREQVIRSFEIFFILVNVAEQNHRIRRRREYLLEEDVLTQPLSIESAIRALKKNRIDAKTVEEALSTLSLELIITAHPTESTKRSVLEIQERIAAILMEMDSPLLTKSERVALRDKLFNEVVILWQTDELRHHKPTVLDEVRSGLYYFDHTLFDVLPEIHRELEENFERYYPYDEWEVPNFLTFGSWIGGDRDGNPFVTHDITWDTLLLQRELVLSKYQERLTDLMKRYSFSTTRVKVSDELEQRLQEVEGKYLAPEKQWRIEAEVYRRFLAVIIERVNLIGKSELGYETPDELLEDLNIIKRSLKKYHPTKSELTTIQKMIRQVQLFGFHLATLDIRNHSKEHESALHEILKKAKIESDYESMTEADKVEILQKVLADPRSILLDIDEYDEKTQEMINVFRTIKRVHKEFGKNAIKVYLVSMTNAPSDLLEVLVLAKAVGIYRLHEDGTVESDLNVAPLLETIGDLSAGSLIMETLFEMSIYRKHLQVLKDKQEIMLGYSDSSKDGGQMAANWKLYKTQIEIYEMASKYEIKPKFFHGRGGSLGRGGGPLNKSLMSQPAETVGTGVKITEQGEVLSSRYLLKDIAYRSLEQAVSALIRTSTYVLQDSEQEYLREDRWVEALDEIADISYLKYKSLIFDDPDFLTYFQEATPLKAIGDLNIGSRPMKRNNKGSFSFGDLRAIPWVFAWTQSRHLLPAWYSTGTGFKDFINEKESNLDLLKEMYHDWPFFKNIIDNLQMALSKADLLTAKEYVTLVEDREVAKRIFSNIEAEYELTKEIVLEISDNKELLEDTPILKESVYRRNPYVDPLNFMQVELLREMREKDEIDDKLMSEILLTIKGISAGMRNTG